MARVLTSVLMGALAALPAAGAVAAQSPDANSVAPETPPGRLMFSRFDEATHTFLGAHTAFPDGSGETVLPLPGPEGGGRWSRSGAEIAVMTIVPDVRVGTAIISADGTVDRVLDLPDATLNAVCVVWPPDDARLACEAWDETDPSPGGLYTVRASDGGDLQRLTTPPEGMVDLPGDYSPDGAWIAFSAATTDAVADIFISRPDGTDQRQVTDTPHNEITIDWGS
jgi:hypothetical protein